MLLNEPPVLGIVYVVPEATVTLVPPGLKVGIVGAEQSGPAWPGKMPPAAEQGLVQVMEPTAANFPVYFGGDPASPTKVPPVMLIEPLETMSPLTVDVEPVTDDRAQNAEVQLPGATAPLWMTATSVRLGPLTGSAPVEMTRRYAGYADDAHGGVQLLTDVVSTQFTMIVAVPSVVEPLVMVRGSPA